MADGAHLLSFQCAVNLQHDGRGGLHLVAREQWTFGHHQVNARGNHLVEAANGARKLAFEGAQIIDILHETGGAQRVRFVENLVTDAAALRQTLTGQRHAQPRDAILRDHDDVAIVA